LEPLNAVALNHVPEDYGDIAKSSSAIIGAAQRMSSGSWHKSGSDETAEVPEHPRKVTRLVVLSVSLASPGHHRDMAWVSLPSGGRQRRGQVIPDSEHLQWSDAVFGLTHEYRHVA